MFSPRQTVLATAVVAFSGCCFAQCQPATFERLGVDRLGSLPNPSGATDTQAAGVSQDGRTVVGTILVPENPYSGTERAFRWSTTSGMQLLDPSTRNYAYGVSADGETVVGTAVGLGPFAYRWTAAGGLLALVEGVSTSSEAYAVSADGAVVVGQQNGYAAIWRTTSTILLPVLVNPSDVSADGSVVVGGSFKWSEQSGLQPLSRIDVWGYQISGVGIAVSDDGTVIVGAVYYSAGAGPNLWAPVRWENDVPALLQPLAPNYSYALAVNGDGRIVVGSSNGRAFVWTQALGVVDLESLLSIFGAPPLPWGLFNATGVSGDGLAIVGTARLNSVFGLQEQAYIARIPMLPTVRPMDRKVCCGEGTLLSYEVASADIPNFEWRVRDAAAGGPWQPLVDGSVVLNGRLIGSVSGCDTGGLQFNCAEVWAGVDTVAFRAIASNACHTMLLAPVEVRVCAADFDCDREVTVGDIFSFLAAWFAGDTRATEFGGATGVPAIFWFLTKWFAGCD